MNWICSPIHLRKSAVSWPPALMLSMLASPPVATPESLPPCTESSCEASDVRRDLARRALGIERHGQRERVREEAPRRRAHREPERVHEQPRLHRDEEG